MSQQMWDERYSSAERVWSGEPNHWLVEEATALVPGTALDVGCGEGADAVWLAHHGWRVTAVDFSQAGLRRAREAARAADVNVRWVHADLATWRPDEQFDLVSVQYFHAQPEIRRQVHRMAWEATRGTLIVVGHHVDHAGGPPVDVRYGADEVLASLGLTGDDPVVAAARQRDRGDARDVVVLLRRNRSRHG